MIKTLNTEHGDILLPVFMPVGTKASVKALTPRDLKELEVSIILGNTYHLYLRPGDDLISKFNGLHDFMSWDGPILTDSGGFQVFSLSKLRKIKEDGVEFRSHIDGSKHFLSPELSIQIQNALNSDIKMVFDECPPGGADWYYIKKSMDLTHSWAKRSKDEWEKLGSKGKLFAIVQGGMFKDLRRESALSLQDIGFNGYALGGFSVGEEKSKMYDNIEAVMEFMPKDKPSYLMGVGEPEDILFAVKQGLLMFDCVIPTRNARNGSLFTFNGKLSIKQKKYFDDKSPIEETCDCYTCKNFSRAYLRHLYMSSEILSSHLNTVHNIRFFMRFMSKIREHINGGTFDTFRLEFLKNYVN